MRFLISWISLGSVILFFFKSCFSLNFLKYSLYSNNKVFCKGFFSKQSLIIKFKLELSFLNISIIASIQELLKFIKIKNTWTYLYNSFLI